MRERISIERFDGGWIVQIPPFLLRGRERGVYVRRTFKEAVNEMDFYLGRFRAIWTCQWWRATLLEISEQGGL